MDIKGNSDHIPMKQLAGLYNGHRICLWSGAS